MTVTARITFGRGKGTASLDAEGIVQVEWDKKPPLLFNRIVRNEIEPLLEDEHATLLPAEAVTLTTEDDVEQPIAIALAQQLNIIWQQAKERGIATRFQSGQFKFRPQDPEVQEHVTNPTEENTVESDDDGLVVR